MQTFIAAYTNLAKKPPLFMNHRENASRRFLHIEDARQIVFTRNTTESINLVATNLGKEIPYKKTTTYPDTDGASFQPCAMVSCCETKWSFGSHLLRLTTSGELDLEQYASLLEQNPKLVAFTHMSNVLGRLIPAKQITAMAHDAGATGSNRWRTICAAFPCEFDRTGCGLFCFFRP